MIPFGDADERLREPVAKEARLAELPHCRVDALNHLLVQDGVGGKGEPPQTAGPQAALGAAEALQPVFSLLHLWALLSSPQGPFLLLSQHTDAGPGSGKDDSLPPRESIPFLCHLGESPIGLCPWDPLRSALVPPLWSLLTTEFCLWWGVWREVQGRSLLRPSLVSRRTIASCLFSRVCSFLGSSVQALNILKVFFVKYSLSFNERGERRGVRQRGDT